MHDCYDFDNFWLSSGCDVPALTDPSQLDEFYAAAEDYYKCHDMLESLEGDFDIADIYERFGVTMGMEF